mmetsp:Transcript_7031/g.6569  ORF Transcript_7031/g.6569 Transcript_7031/m.6569 type:complete len:123 (+) Transcript_7031:1-369(+)
MEKSYDHLFKILFIGDSGVGKLDLLMLLLGEDFNDNLMTRIGIDFKVKTVDIDEKKVKLQIWDTAGQERFKNVTTSYFKGAHGVVLIYDVTDKKSFENIYTWMTEIENKAPENIHIILVGNK